jgi:hypothetical protein
MRSVRVGLQMSLCAVFALAAILYAPAAASAVQFTVSATQGWQQTPITFTQGEAFTITYASGQWTVDSRNWPYVGNDGYDQATDHRILAVGPACKFVGFEPFGTLLWTNYGHPDRAVMGGHMAGSSGPLSFRINDVDGCLGDNAGSIRVDITKTTPPPTTPPPTTPPPTTPPPTTPPPTTTTPNSPAAPSNITATALTPTTIRVQWTDNSSNEAAFTIYEGTTGAVQQVGANTTFLDQGGLAPRTRRCFVVRAEGAPGGTGPSQYVPLPQYACATTPSGAAPSAGVAAGHNPTFADLQHLTDAVWTWAKAQNKLCRWFKTCDPWSFSRISKLISNVGKAQQITSLAEVVRLAIVLGDDLKATNNALAKYCTPHQCCANKWPPEVIRAAKKARKTVEQMSDALLASTGVPFVNHFVKLKDGSPIKCR